MMEYIGFKREEHKYCEKCGREMIESSDKMSSSYDKKTGEKYNGYWAFWRCPLAAYGMGENGHDKGWVGSYEVLNDGLVDKWKKLGAQFMVPVRQSRQ